jgi:hypothetical protein
MSAARTRRNFSGDESRVARHSRITQHPLVTRFGNRLARRLRNEYRWAEGRPERYNEIAAEFVRLKVDVIVTAGTPAAAAAKQILDQFATNAFWR